MVLTEKLIKARRVGHSQVIMVESFGKLVNAFIEEEMKFSIKDFFSKCDQVCRMRIWSHFMKKFLIENFIFCAVLLAISAKVSLYLFDSVLNKPLHCHPHSLLSSTFHETFRKTSRKAQGMSVRKTPFSKVTTNPQVHWIPASDYGRVHLRIIVNFVSEQLFSEQFGNMQE